MNVELRELISAEFIYRETRNKKREPGESGHKEAFVYFIKTEAYSIIDKILLNELKKEAFKLRAVLEGQKYWPLHISESLRRFYCWNRTKNPEIFDKYIQKALDSAEYKEVEGEPYRASIPSIPQLSNIIVGKENSREELKSYLEEWIGSQLWLGLLPIPPRDDRHIDTLLPLSIDPLILRNKIESDNLMEEAVRENIRLTNEWIAKQKAKNKEEP